MAEKKVLDFVGYSKRLDIFATDELPEFSRALVQKMIKDGKITVNGKKVKPSLVGEFGTIIVSPASSITSSII